MTTHAHSAARGGGATGELALITRAQQGDREAFAELYRMHHGVIAALIGRRVRSNTALAEDLTADVFMKAWAKITTFTWKGTSIRAWLCTIARNAVTDHFKTATTRHLTFVDHITQVGDAWAPEAGNPEDTVLSSLALDDLRHALSEITPRQQDVIRLRFLGEMSVHETARTMGTTDAAVKTLQWRALDSLRKAYVGAVA
ncbi:sigma-70 family RNA polymerase sigma factor [Streptomyces sp. NBC_00557]|uniref:sigma-70 family RNA polymerase sigma factor n=1 Tax=Streptomyces sp. NBC_00557 TaxID=2975776 RepID=UPI002E82000D|nr:sigma-70 family RNA polymerase sigma factor [Streptomyces sp. NBC_00557]WUC40259.1 sigma-70 family RNA polymerase sigma factor [Streptomyces sp. NBC_00557]